MSNRHRRTPERRDPLTVPTCAACGKAQHATKADAKRFGKQHHPRGDVRPYRCQYGGPGWHLGHLPDPVIAGRQPRSYAQQARR